jgi:hypothetical protein
MQDHPAAITVVIASIVMSAIALLVVAISRHRSLRAREPANEHCRKSIAPAFVGPGEHLRYQRHLGSRR